MSDFTGVASWTGFVYVVVVIDAFAPRIVGWSVSRSAKADFVLDALEQASPQPFAGEDLVHHSDRGSPYVCIRYTERLVEAGIEPSVGSVGDSYDDALAETVIGLLKTEVIHRGGAPSRLSSSRPSTGWTGSTIAAPLSRSATSLPPRRKAAYYAQFEVMPLAA